MCKEKLSNDNFILYCASKYENGAYSSTEDFVNDLNRIKYIKKLITRFTEGGELKERLILNHIIILGNCFGPSALCKILYLKLEQQMSYIKPFLVLINMLPEKIYNVGDKEEILTDVIPMNQEIVDKLRLL